MGIVRTRKAHSDAVVVLNHEELEFVLALSEKFDCLEVKDYKELRYVDDDEVIYEVTMTLHENEKFGLKIKDALTANEICF